MVENSKIEWTDHTFNPWIGCQKVSPGCDHCYAETWDARGLQQHESRWGPHATRTRTSAANWRKPLAWNRAAQAAGKRARVFCASLADVGDNHHTILREWRDDLMNLVERTPYLDWMFLTKRPQNIAKLYPEWMTPGEWPSNLWIGTTCENQAEADARIPHLLAIPAPVRFISAEPLLGPVDLTRVGNLSSVSAALPRLVRDIAQHMRPHQVSGIQIEAVGAPWQATTYYQTPDHMGGFEVGPRKYPRLDWVIVGGESGRGARPMHPDWARSLRDQCNAAGVAFFFKQWGNWHSDALLYTDTEGRCPPPSMNIGKARAGRLLDGREWNEVPHG